MRSPRRPRIMRATGGGFHLTWRIAVTKPEDPGTPIGGFMNQKPR